MIAVRWLAGFLLAGIAPEPGRRVVKLPAVLEVGADYGMAVRPDASQPAHEFAGKSSDGGLQRDRHGRPRKHCLCLGRLTGLAGSSKLGARWDAVEGV